jgi:hypothetical protein
MSQPPLATESSFWKYRTAWAVDAGMLALLNLIQLRGRKTTTQPEEIDQYLDDHGHKSLEQFYSAPFVDERALASCLPPAEATPRLDAIGLPVGYPLCWKTPHPSGYEANDQARADFYPCQKHWPEAPTVFFFMR